MFCDIEGGADILSYEAGAFGGAYDPDALRVEVEDLGALSRGSSRSKVSPLGMRIPCSQF